MPIRINLLAEAQAVEELRRRDPVKRAILVAIVAVVLVLGWWSILFGNSILVRSNLTRYENDYNALTNKYTQVISNQNRLRETQSKLTMLNRYAASRFLYASALDALQHSVIDNVRLTGLHFDQTFESIPDVAATTNPDTGKKTPGKPGHTTERDALFLEARDNSDNPGGEQISRLMMTLAANPYFQDQHLTTNSIKLLKSDSPQPDNESRRLFVLFNVECQFPEQIHSR